MAAVGQRWKVSPEGGIAVREGREPSSQELPERLPKGAIISELECVGTNLHYLRVSSEGPQTGWLSMRSASGKDLLERCVPSKRKAAESAATQQAPAVRLAKAPTQRENRELKVSTGSQWLVIAEDSLVVRKGQRTTSQKVPECLPSGAIVEEVEVAGNRLHFLSTSGVGASSGWVSITDKGQERLQRVAQLSDPLASLEGMNRGFLSNMKVDLYTEGSTEEEQAEEADRPLEGWAALSKLFGREVREVTPRPQPGAAAAAETMGGRRRMPRQALPPVDDLENLDETALVDALGFDPMAAKEFANLPRTQKRKMIAEARALIEMGPEKRMEALDSYRRAWPKGPFPELTPAVEDTSVLPPGSCFPYSRHLREVPSGLAPEWGLEAPAGKAVRTFFQRRITSTHEAQKEFFRSLKCEVTSSSGFLSAEAGAGHPDPCAMGDLVDKDQLANTIISKSPARPEDVCRYLNGELHQRVCLLDGRMGARLAQETLEESDFRGERFKSFKETDAAGKPISLQGNSEMLVLTKASLIGDIHKEYLEAGSDIIRTHTFSCNALTQKEYKMDKLVYEMNKSAAQLAKRATAEVTKANPKKPRFVAGVIGDPPCMMSLTPGAVWSEMVESYNEQIKGLVEGGVDILILEGVTDALNAKAAIFAIDAFFAKTNKKRIPLMIGAHIAASGRTPAGQSAEAFCISVQYSKPFALGISSTEAPGPMRTHYQPLADLHLGWCIATPSVAGDNPEKFASTVMEDAKEGLLNIVGGDAGALPSHIAALAKRFEDASARRLPGRPHAACLQLCGLDACLVKPEEGFQVVGSRSTVMGSAAFKRKVSAYKATRQSKHLLEAMQVCIEQCGNGADILDFNLDSDLSSGPACPARGVMSSFLQMASAEPRVAKVPFMLCSCQWDTIREGLKCVQGKCIVNGVALALGEEEFLRIAKECRSFGAALVVLAITDEGEPAEKYDDKVRICQQSYKLLRSKLDFPAEDIILDCQALLLGLPEFASRTADFIKAVAELKRTCPGASFVGGVNNISLPFRGLNMLRDALHSVFLYHAVPKGLNLAMTWPGALPLYSEIDAETRTLCEEMILNASADGKHLERFNAFVSFRSNSLACLPVQHFGSSMRTEDAQGDDWAKPPAVQKEAQEAQRELMAQRRVVPPNQQKSFLKSLQCNVSSSAQLVKAEAGAGLADIVRVQGTLDRDGLVNTIVAKGTVRRDDLGRYFNGELRTRVFVMAAPGQEKQLGELDYKEYFSAGCDVCGTSTLQATTYDENRRAAQMAKSAAADVTRKDSQKPRFVAGVIGPTSHALSSSPSADDPSHRSATWDELVAVYTEQIRGLVDGGADLLALEGVSDTLNAKAAIFAIDAYFEQTDKERLPLLITAVIADNGKMPSGQSIEAFLISIKHAKPMSVGISGVVGKGDLQKVSKALSDLSLSWCHISASIGSGESADALASSLATLAGDKLVNIIGARGASASQMAAVAGKVASASPRALPAVPGAPALQLSGLEAYFVKPGDSCHMVGQRCSMGGSKAFKGFIDAYKYTKKGNAWEAARDLCGAQCEAGADILDFNFDSELTDSKWAMGNFMRLCATDAKVAKVPFILSSMKWAVIEEGLRSVPGKSIVNAISLVQGEEAFIQMAKACQRYGAAVIVMTVDTPDEFPSFREKARIGQKAYKLLRTRLDFPAEDIIFDCNVRPMGSQESTKDFLDAVAELKRTCPLVSFIGGVSNLSLPYRSVPPLRQALHSVFLYHAIPMGLNLAIVDPGVLPRYSDIEAQTRRVCEEAILHGQADGSAMDDLESYAAFLSGAAADEIPTALVAAYDMPAAIPLRLRSSPGFTQKIEALVQGTGTINASIFQTFGSKSHACLAFHRSMPALTVKRSVWFSSISVWMGQGGSGPVTGCSCLMDGCSLHERWQQLGNVGVAVEWGAIGEIGLRRTVYGSRDVFAQFDLGQKLIGPADTQKLMRVVCTGGPDPYEVVGMAYLDQTWQMTLAGVTSGGALERKSFADM